jgi:NADH-quinone oxidoreductase subunit K
MPALLASIGWEVEPTHFLILSGVLFLLGVAGVLTRRGVITMLMSIELMLNAANLALVTFSRSLPAGMPGVDPAEGQVVVFFVIALAAAEAAVGLGIVYALFRLKGSTDADLANLMKW